MENMKKQIDAVRDTIVGKIPMPNTQVEQITLALLYKFMDDMDQNSIDFGGNATFFSGDFEKYSWKKIMNNSNSAQARYNLYTEALEKFYSHPTIPETFREIFKNAGVPYKDPETLTNFLKQIDKSFDYSNSEQLGDAYEYLLSLLGSQGDLGQFRTPRHLIDFIVDIVNPNKEDSILDPACGTAGFLISAYRHILRANKDENGKNNLTFDEQKRILHNITGYDIEPSMVRIAEMNLFLHGASEPRIFEYDTLTMDDKWNEKYDCILANPPFMTPTGGIRPHSRFDINASRSEVLFVDYIVGHLRSKGKAGVIVPDTILFSDSALSYKNLRKLMFENGLYAILSLPAGIFKPYAKDVKTSILFFNKEYENNYIENKDIIENEYIFLTNKYNKTVRNNTKYEYHLLGEYIEENKEKVKDGKYNVWSVSNKIGFVRSEDYHSEQVASSDIKNYKVIGKNYFAFNPSRINVGSIALNKTDEIGCVSPMYVSFKIKKTEFLDPEYLLILLKSAEFKKIINNEAYGAVRKQLRYKSLEKIEIPLPTYDEQRKIVNNISKLKDKIVQLSEEIDKTSNDINEILFDVVN